MSQKLIIYSSLSDMFCHKILITFFRFLLLKYVNAASQLCSLIVDVFPKVVLASTADLNCGFARDLFIKWAGSANNSIIFTTLKPAGTLARKLIDNPDLGSIELEVRFIQTFNSNLSTSFFYSFNLHSLHVCFSLFVYLALYILYVFLISLNISNQKQKRFYEFDYS